MLENEKKLVEAFINKIKEKYTFKGFNLGYTYNEKEDLFLIWYNKKTLKTDVEFNTFVNILIDNIFFENDMYNLYFYYDSSKEMEFDFSFTPQVTSTVKQWNDVKMKFNKKQSLSNFATNTDSFSLEFKKISNQNGIEYIGNNVDSNLGNKYALLA